MVNELQRDLGDITVDLGQAERRDFVAAFLDSEPNRLGDAFRAMPYWQTRGQPLFTIEADLYLNRFLFAVVSLLLMMSTGVAYDLQSSEYRSAETDRIGW